MCFKFENIEDKYFKNSITAYTYYNGDKNEALNSSRRDYFSNNMSLQVMLKVHLTKIKRR